MKNKKSTTVIMAFILLIGLSLLLYPTVADKWNAFHQSRAIIHHAENMAKFTAEECEVYRSAAVDFNDALRNNGGRWTLTSDEKKTYESLLVTDDTNIIAYVEIPKIKVSLPIYHGTGKDVLQSAIGHLEGSSLPVGGKGTHCVLVGVPAIYHARHLAAAQYQHLVAELKEHIQILAHVEDSYLPLLLHIYHVIDCV